MNGLSLIVTMVFGFLIIAGGIMLFFTRAGKNLIAGIIFRTKYVVCHLKNENTGYTEIWKVVPPVDKMTRVGKHYYNLSPKYSLMEWKGRLHFQLNEADVIPRYLERTNSNEEIIIQVDETDTAINTKAYKIIYGKEKNIALLLCAVAFLVALLTSIYAIYSIDKMTNTIQFLYVNASIIRT